MKVSKCENCGDLDVIRFGQTLCADCREGMKIIPRILAAMKMPWDDRPSMQKAVIKSLNARINELKCSGCTGVSFNTIANNELIDARRGLRTIGDYADYFKEKS